MGNVVFIKPVALCHLMQSSTVHYSQPTGRENSLCGLFLSYYDARWVWSSLRRFVQETKKNMLSSLSEHNGPKRLTKIMTVRCILCIYA